ncbi:MAG: peroxiredoxin [Candidatus Methylopumilus sp.]|jgi:peroxiredoxin Q/BCP|nr:peroxiredoxin [Candidatus Methylopumilus sp.]NBW61443.1 peroxiredoxin [Methylophilaceae bacterium]
MTTTLTVPDFELPSTGNKTFKLSQHLNQTLIIYFYPKDATPGCTTQGQQFRDHYDEFKALNVEIVGVSRDTIRSHENFKAKYQFPFELLADTEEIACKIFDVVKMKKMYGKEVRGIERSTFILDAQGKIIKEWRGVKVDGHIQEILTFLRS